MPEQESNVSRQPQKAAYLPGNLPLYSLFSLGIIITAIVVVILFVPLDKAHTPVVISLTSTLVASIPALVAAIHAERASKDIRNGVITEKVEDALDNKGVTQAVAEGQRTTPAALDALTAMLKQIDSVSIQGHHDQPPSTGAQTNG